MMHGEGGACVGDVACGSKWRSLKVFDSCGTSNIRHVNILVYNFSITVWTKMWAYPNIIGNLKKQTNKKKHKTIESRSMAYFAQWSVRKSLNINHKLSWYSKSNNLQHKMQKFGT